MSADLATTSSASAALNGALTGGTPGQQRERFHQLDGLRAVAASLVIFHHMVTASIASSIASKGHQFAANAIATTTASGVELFFVLSGCLLLRPYLRGSRPMKPAKYLVGRAKRLWPPYFAAWLLAGVVILLTTRFPSWWTVGANLPAFSPASWAAQLGIVYVGSNAYSFAWWSLSVEVLFYLLAPLIVLAVMWTKLSKRQMAAVLVGAMLLAVLATNMGAGVLPAHLWPIRRFCTYLPCFVAGVILARFDCSDRWGWRSLATGIPYCLLAFAFPRMDVHVGWGLIYFGIVILSLNGQVPLKRLLSTWIFVWIGERSYSLFLTHYSVITAVCQAASFLMVQKGAAYFLATRIVELPLVFLTAMLLFHFVERRFAKNLYTANYFWPSIAKPLPSRSQPSPSSSPNLAPIPDAEPLTVPIC